MPSKKRMIFRTKSISCWVELWMNLFSSIKSWRARPKMHRFLIWIYWSAKWMVWYQKRQWWMSAPRRSVRQISSGIWSPCRGPWNRFLSLHLPSMTRMHWSSKIMWNIWWRHRIECRWMTIQRRPKRQSRLWCSSYICAVIAR